MSRLCFEKSIQSMSAKKWFRLDGPASEVWKHYIYSNVIGQKTLKFKKILSFSIAEENVLPEICCSHLKKEEQCMRRKSLTWIDKMRTQNSARAASELRTLSLREPGRKDWNCGYQPAGSANSHQNIWHGWPNKNRNQPFVRTEEVSESRTDCLASAWSFTVQPLPCSFSSFIV